MCWKLTAVYHNIIKLYVWCSFTTNEVAVHSVATFSNVLVCMRSAGLTVLVHSVARI